LSTLPNPIIALVIPDTTPVNVGEARFAFKFNAVWVAVETDLFASDVLSTLLKPTIALVIPETVPVNVGEARFAFKFNAVWVAVEIGLLASEVLSTLPKPTFDFSIPVAIFVLVITPSAIIGDSALPVKSPDN
jgi:hypothetical protein